MQIVLLDFVETFIESLNEKEVAKTIRTIELLEEFGNETPRAYAAGYLLKSVSYAN